MTENPLPSDHQARMDRALLSIEGLSVGDALGQQFFYVEDVEHEITQRNLPASPWHYTDDTEMSLAIAQVLSEWGSIEEDVLAETFARRYAMNPHRGYGGTAHGILEAIGLGQKWREISSIVFDGQGSMGNGGAMRVAPVGAYFADDFDRVAVEARKSAIVTHYHPEGQAGAIAIAIASACASQSSEEGADSLFEMVLRHTPNGETREGIKQAATTSRDLSPRSAASLLGNGSRIISPDTVPFALWCASRHLDDYVEAMWATVEGLGDIDTNCAIVGGIVSLSADEQSIPMKWREARETLLMTI